MKPAVAEEDHGFAEDTAKEGRLIHYSSTEFKLRLRNIRRN